VLYLLLKTGISALILVAVSEVAKRSSLFGALIASLPLTSLLAILWMRWEKTESKAIADLSQSIFYLVLPSLAFFFLFPLFLNRGMQFWLSLGLAVAVTIALYLLMLILLNTFSNPIG
jgi:hypothetical protein